MKIILIPCAITILLILFEVFVRKIKHNPIFYIRIFTIMLGTYLLLDSLQANENRFTPNAQIEISAFRDFESLSPHHIKYFRDKIAYHTEEGRKSFNKAQEISLLIPDLTHRDMAKQLFAAAIFTSANGIKSFSSIVLGLSVLLLEYSFCIYDQWNDIQFNLNSSAYHYEMMEFYTDALKNG